MEYFKEKYQSFTKNLLYNDEEMYDLKQKFEENLELCGLLLY